MEFVELNRSFAPLRKGQEPSLDLGRVWGGNAAGWLGWGDLRERKRVILLAEASAGKSEEFRNQTKQLNSEGLPAFYVRIEELADYGFGSALDVDSAQSFESWRSGVAKGWFFLDSIDEARLNRKGFDSALKRFSRELGTALERAHVFISCRVTDWKGPDDLASITQWLPEQQTAQPPSDRDEDSALFEPIFNKTKRTIKSAPAVEKAPHELLVIQLVPLLPDQYRKLAAASGITDLDAFVSGVIRSGLNDYAERPGDLLDLATYWKDRREFGSFADMIEYNITRKLQERDKHRPDNEVLSPADAYDGAARLAAAMTFIKSFTLRVPHDDPDPVLGAGALDAALILNDWTAAKCNALLRRGVFAPASYGRIRFHHRSTQEYLTARWLHRLLALNCPQSEVWRLLLVGRYGVDTVVPSLRPTAAWLSIWHPDLRDEIIRREPLVLMRHGDPASLPLEARRRLLTVFAAKHNAAEISEDHVGDRELRAFAHQDLAGTIREVWPAPGLDDIRLS
jgi:hypothetical protein